LDTPPTGTTEPLDTPATGSVNPIDATPTGRPRIDPRDALNEGNTVAGATAPSMQIGTLTVDQSGTGRMQQVVEGVRVQDVIGQAILIHSQGGAGQTTLPPNLDTTADPQTALTNDPNQTVQSAGVQSPGDAAATARATQSRVAAGTQEIDSTLVAGGVIRSMSSPLPATGAGTQVNPNQPLPTDGQVPAETQNQVPRNSAVPAPQQPTR
jgi:hypothetical protein